MQQTESSKSRTSSYAEKNDAADENQNSKDVKN